jgi:hypothetical protein
MIEGDRLLAQDSETFVATEKTLMEKRTNMIETVGLPIGAAQSHLICRGVSLRRAHGSTLVVMTFGVAGQDRREQTRRESR